jgi:hypothetical protein
MIPLWNNKCFPPSVTALAAKQFSQKVLQAFRSWARPVLTGQFPVGLWRVLSRLRIRHLRLWPPQSGVAVNRRSSCSGTLRTQLPVGAITADIWARCWITRTGSLLTGGKRVAERRIFPQRERRFTANQVSSLRWYRGIPRDQAPAAPPSGELVTIRKAALTIHKSH